MKRVIAFVAFRVALAFAAPASAYNGWGATTGFTAHWLTSSGRLVTSPADFAGSARIVRATCKGDLNAPHFYRRGTYGGLITLYHHLWCAVALSNGHAAAISIYSIGQGNFHTSKIDIY